MDLWISIRLLNCINFFLSIFTSRKQPLKSIILELEEENTFHGTRIWIWVFVQLECIENK